MKRLQRLCSVCLIFGMLFTLVACGKEEAIPELISPIQLKDAVHVAEKTTLLKTQHRDGSVVAKTVEMSLESETVAYDIQVTIGDTVEKGDILFYIEPDIDMEVADLELQILKLDT